LRIFQYWTRVRGTADWKGETLPISALGGSNRSKEDAERDARTRLQFIENRIRGIECPDDSYEADILEEPLQRIDEGNVITRNRYGAEVLNSRDHFFIDLDFLPRGCLGMFLPRPNRAEQIAERIAFVEKCMPHPLLRGRSVRLYETHKGLRGLISGSDHSPTADNTKAIMTLLRADWLYAILCRKQDCFRARLTPKPYRMKARTMRFTYPRNTDENAEVAAWVSEYDGRSRQFATCCYLKTIGPEFSDMVIRLHDERTGAHSGRRLA
jgi:hypothetical protein